VDLKESGLTERDALDRLSGRARSKQQTPRNSGTNARKKKKKI
jgi:hypothetical protein